MSWFDTTGFASLAKSALKEAQKQIDKALDIKVEELENSNTNNPTMIKTEPSTPSFATTSDKPPPIPKSNSVWDAFPG